MNKVLAKKEQLFVAGDADDAGASRADAGEILTDTERSFFAAAARGFCDNDADAFSAAARGVVERLAPDPQFRAAFAEFMKLFPAVPFDPE